MQNSPLLVTKMSPVKNINSAINQEPSKAQSNSFENMLSKRVKQNETQAKAIKNGNANKASTSKGKSSIKGDDQQTKAGTPVDTQLLAREDTKKRLDDVTDVKVTIDPPQEARILQAPLSNIAQASQVATQNATEVIEADGFEPLERLVVDSDVVADDKTAEDDNRLQRNATQNQPLKADNEKLNPRFANGLATETKSQAVDEIQTETNIKGLTDVAAMSLQAGAAKPAATLVLPSSPLQAGASNMLNSSPGKAGWTDAVSQKVVWMVGATEHSATLTLNPKDLGPLQVIINVNNEKADATFISENPEVRKALEDGMSSLRNAMGQAGVELGQANVNTSKQHQGFQQANKEGAARQGNGTNAGLEGEKIVNQPVNTRVSNGLVDTFV